MHLTDVSQNSAGTAVMKKLQAALAGQKFTRWGLSPEAKGALDRFLAALPVSERIALLKAAVQKLPACRASNRQGAQRTGALLYAAAVALYRARLPLTEGDLCDLLVLTRLDDGYGDDTRPPFDLAREYQRKHGYSVKLAEAIDVFVGNFPKSSAIKVRELRRSAALLAVLDPRPAAGNTRTWWINEVRASLSAIAGDERREWERLVLAMSVSERMQMPKNWERHARSAIEALGDALVIRRLTEWWPDAKRARVSLEGSGAQLLKHFI